MTGPRVIIQHTGPGPYDHAPARTLEGSCASCGEALSSAVEYETQSSLLRNALDTYVDGRIERALQDHGVCGPNSARPHP